MRRTEKAYGGSYDGEFVTCETVGKFVDGTAVWAEVLECGHHDILFTLHKSEYIGYHFKASDPNACEWNCFDSYHPCDCWIVNR